MSKKMVMNWETYWSQFDDLELLQCKSVNLDDTLVEIQQKLDRKLLSGDHWQIIDSLEERIEELDSLRRFCYIFQCLN